MKPGVSFEKSKHLKIIALHGFLGQPQDFSLLPQAFATAAADSKTPVDWTCRDLWQDLRQMRSSLGPPSRFALDAHGEAENFSAQVIASSALSAWAQLFTDELAAGQQAELVALSRKEQASTPLAGLVVDSPSFSTSKPVLFGYSMGGRLAFHAALRRPDLFSGLVIASAHPGLQNETERRARLKNDLAWAERFRHENWDELLEAWNSQGVLASSPERRKDEADFHREELAFALERFSLAGQRDLRSDLRSLKLPVLLVSGAADIKFTLELSGLAAGSALQHVVVPEVGHRVPLDQPEVFARHLHSFTAALSGV